MAREKGEATGVDSRVKKVRQGASRTLCFKCSQGWPPGSEKGRGLKSAFCEISPGHCGPVLDSDVHLCCMQQYFTGSGVRRELFLRRKYSFFFFWRNPPFFLFSIFHFFPHINQHIVFLCNAVFTLLCRKTKLAKKPNKNRTKLLLGTTLINWIEFVF